MKEELQMEVAVKEVPLKLHSLVVHSQEMGVNARTDIPHEAEDIVLISLEVLEVNAEPTVLEARSAIPEMQEVKVKNGPVRISKMKKEQHIPVKKHSSPSESEVWKCPSQGRIHRKEAQKQNGRKNNSIPKRIKPLHARICGVRITCISSPVVSGNTKPSSSEVEVSHLHSRIGASPLPSAYQSTRYGPISFTRPRYHRIRRNITTPRESLQYHDPLPPDSSGNNTTISIRVRATLRIKLLTEIEPLRWKFKYLTLAHTSFKFQSEYEFMELEPHCDERIYLAQILLEISIPYDRGKNTSLVKN